jgi:hypothetical protein
MSCAMLVIFTPGIFFHSFFGGNYKKTNTETLFKSVKKMYHQTHHHDSDLRASTTKHFAIKHGK